MTETIYIAPGGSQCRVYAIPYAMRPGQSPRDIGYQYQRQWTEIGLLNAQLRLVCLDQRYTQWSDDIDGAGPGTFFEIESQETVDAQR